MDTRGPTDREPKSEPIYVRLGMTKGAMIAFAVIFAVAVAGFFRVEAIAQDQKALLRKTRVQLVVANHVLTELCRTNEIILGLVRGTETLFKFQTGILPPPPHAGPNPPIGKPLVNPALVPFYLQALNVFLGWENELEQQSACERIQRP